MSYDDAAAACNKAKVDEVVKHWKMTNEEFQDADIYMNK